MGSTLSDAAPPATAHQAAPRILGRLLVEREGLSESDLSAALTEQRDTRERLGRILVRKGFLNEEAVARALATQLGLPFVAGPLEPGPGAERLLPGELARERQVLVLGANPKRIRLAMGDPLDLTTVDEIQFRVGRRVEPVVASPGAVREAHDRARGGSLGELLAQLPSHLPGEDDEDTGLLEEAARAAPVVRLVDHILRRGVERSASDIHIEREGEEVRVRYRLDGVLRTEARLPARIQGPLLSRLKITAGMDISVKRRPQDGGLTLRHGDRELRLRVSTLPAAGGEKAVVRILDPRSAPRGLDDLGLSHRDLERLRRLILAGQGVVLSAGPTGSGKTSTLVAALAELDRESLNVVTLEDPVEYRLDGVSQVQVHPRAGLTFPTALRAVLRQDPDVVLVGEIRDRETAEIAMAAAVTGHLVLSTIHTTDAPGAVTRLLHMGVPPYLVAGGLTGVVAQRLIRRSCSACQGRAGACDRCADGYLGRTGVFQVLATTDALREAVVRGGSAAELQRLSRGAGMSSLADDARRKVADGVTTPHEVARVIRADPGAALPCDGCGGDVPTGAAGCPWCGRSQQERCACGREIGSGWRFCPDCLRKVARVETRG